MNIMEQILKKRNEYRVHNLCPPEFIILSKRERDELHLCESALMVPSLKSKIYGMKIIPAEFTLKLGVISEK